MPASRGPFGVWQAGGQRDVVVVGGSLAGLRAVEALRTAGYDGRVTVVGAETRQPYDRPPLSKKVLAGEWEPDRIALRATATSARSTSTWRLGRPPPASTSTSGS